MVYGARTHFAGRVDIFDLNWDNTHLDQIRHDFNITGRSQYVLISPTGEVIKHWYGPLPSTFIHDMDAILADAGFQ